MNTTTNGSDGKRSYIGVVPYRVVGGRIHVVVIRGRPRMRLITGGGLLHRAMHVEARSLAFDRAGVRGPVQKRCILATSSHDASIPSVFALEVHEGGDRLPQPLGWVYLEDAINMLPPLVGEALRALPERVRMVSRQPRVAEIPLEVVLQDRRLVAIGVN